MNWTRREMMAGAALGSGAFLLNPMLTRLRAEAAGSPPPTRFVFVVEGNGLNPHQIQPIGIERKKNAHNQNNVEQIEDVSLADQELPEALKPVEKFKHRMTIIQGLSGRVAGGGHSNNFGALGCYNGKGQNASGETIDAALAKAVPGVFPLVNLGISDRPEHSMIYNVSAWEANKKLPTQCNPDLAYGALFGSVASGDARQEFNADRNLLDFMIDDVRRAEAGLAGPEREKLQAYLSSFETMRARQDKLLDMQRELTDHAPKVTNKYRSEVETDRLDAHFEIGAAALISGLTNVLTIASGSGDPYFSVKFTGLGINFAKHGIGHGGSYNGKTWDQLAIKIRSFHFAQIAKLMRDLDAVPEGDGTMLDNTLIVYLSDAAEGHHSRCWEWPFVLFGNLGGRLRTDGRYLCYPKYGNTGHRTVSNLYTTFLHTVGQKRDRFGWADPMLKGIDQDGPLQELLA